MNIFEFNDYKKIINEFIKINQKIPSYKSKLADAAGCQRSFLSQVLKTHINLTPEHAFGVSIFWELSNLEREYFLELVNLARSGKSSYSKYISQKLSQLKLDNYDMAKRFNKTPDSLEKIASVYYSSWYYSAMHIICTIPAYQQTAEIAKYLSLDEKFVSKILTELESMGLLVKKNSKWQVADQNIHSPKKSIWTSMHHSNWRNKSVKKMLESSTGQDSIYYTGVYSISKTDAIKLHEMCINFIEQSRKLVESSDSEDLIAFILDCFSVASD